jgi:signal transduction histidine kinase
MIILLTILITSAIVLFIVKAKSPSAYWMALVLVGWFISMMGFILFLSKYGGFYYHVNLILFLDDRIRQLLLTSPISIDWISRLIIIGRSLFIFSLTGLSVQLFYNLPFRETWPQHMLNSILPLMNIWFYDPVIYRSMISLFAPNNTFIISLFTRAWVVCSGLLALAAMIWRYRRISVPWVKNRLKQILLGVFSLVVFYFYLVFMGPLQVTDARTYYFLYWDFSNFNPPLTMVDWYIGIGLTGFASIQSTISIWKYTEIQDQLGKPDLHLARKLKTANMGVRVFTHGIKNQLLMTQLLVNQTLALVDSPNAPGSDQVKQNLGQIGGIVGQTVNRLDQLYKSFKTASLELSPLPNTELIKLTVAKVKTVPKNVTITSQIRDECLILVDPFHLSEALYNVVNNAVEAIAPDQNGLIAINATVEEKWCIIRIQDNGSGIAPENLTAIFDPFFTNKNTNRNWGVGLSYTKQIINAHFGQIIVESVPDEGSQFSIFLPVYTINV